MKYNFMITEYLRRSVRVEADDAEEAYQKVEDLLSEDKIDLTVDDLSDRDIQTIDDFENSEGRTCNETYPVDDDFSEPTKTFEQWKYANITFPVRLCEGNNGEFFRYVGSTLMEKVLKKEDDSVIDEEAKELDNSLDYYIPHDVLMNASDDEIFDYIYKNIDETVFDFEEE